jgi:hypothetical protein
MDDEKGNSLADSVIEQTEQVVSDDDPIDIHLPSQLLNSNLATSVNFPLKSVGKDKTMFDNFASPIYFAIFTGWLKSILFFPSYFFRSFQPTIVENELLSILAEGKSERLDQQLEKLYRFDRQFCLALVFTLYVLEVRKQFGDEASNCRIFLDSGIRAELYQRNPLKYDHGQDCIFPNFIRKISGLSLLLWFRFYLPLIEHVESPFEMKKIVSKEMILRMRIFNWKKFLLSKISQYRKPIFSCYVVGNLCHFGYWFYQMHTEGKILKHHVWPEKVKSRYTKSPDVV